MKKVFAFLSSHWLMAALMLIFAISIATATFIENDFGTTTARKLIYNAKWFEILLLLGGINILSVIIRNRMFRKEKIPVFFFHSAFLIILLGAGITRYSGQEGIMHIREGDTSNLWISSEAYLAIHLKDQNNAFNKSFPVSLSEFSGNRIKKKISFAGHRITVELDEYYPAAKKILVPDSNGKPIIKLVKGMGRDQSEIILMPEQQHKSDSLIFSFSPTTDTLVSQNEVRMFLRDGRLFFCSSLPVTRISMTDRVYLPLGSHSTYLLDSSMAYQVNGTVFRVNNYIHAGRMEVIPADPRDGSMDEALRFRIVYDTVERTAIVFGNKDQPGQLTSLTINDTEMAIKYGPVTRLLPFSLMLNDFILKRYPGSESPSWFESSLRLIDEDKQVNRLERIYMNHVLKHRGYRFYQSSYDADEKGTILAVNHDAFGTAVTYAGYLLMTLGMLLSLFNRNSRFARLLKGKAAVSARVRSVFIGSLLFLPAALIAQDGYHAPTIPEKKAGDFGTILLQNSRGRIEPVSTLASGVLRKLARKEYFLDQSPEQVLLGMIVFPEYWQQEPMIRVAHPELKKTLGITSGFASYADFFDPGFRGKYVLKSKVEDAYRKKPGQRSKLDNELIKVDERLNIAYMVYSGAVFRIFPDPHDNSHTWHSPLSAPAVFSGNDSLFSSQVLSYYVQEIKRSLSTGDWEVTDKLVDAMKNFQSEYGRDILPDPSRIKAEIVYYKLNLYDKVARLYLFIGLILLLIQFTHIFLPRFPVRYVNRSALILILLTFSAHTAALGLRWYIAGHAPWSNGYETLTFIAWSVILAGMIFSFKSGITLSATAVLSALTLQIAHLSWMDPQITNLVPVLQSYWLNLHVTVITSSYGFLGLGAILAALNLLLLCLQNNKNYERLEEIIGQLTGVIELTLMGGLYLLTVGTFLGAIWANESWGRYWAWDPKETWALITVIVYAFILHMRLVPGIKGRILFTIFALTGFGSVLMTYFGVNYYLSGLHSYASGDPPSIPAAVFYAAGAIFLLSVTAVLNQSRFKKTA